MPPVKLAVIATVINSLLELNRYSTSLVLRCNMCMLSKFWSFKAEMEFVVLKARTLIRFANLKEILFQTALLCVFGIEF